MTLQELCAKYGYAESTVKNKFPTVRDKILKDKGVLIVKSGRGANADYTEEFKSDCRAVTMYQEPPHDIFMTSDLSLMNWEFHIFLAVVTTPMCTFRGTTEQLMGYMGVPLTPSNIDHCTTALCNLVNRNLLGFWVDPTDNRYFSLMIYRSVELEMRISYNMITTCQELAEAAGKRSWVPLLKTWLGVQMLEKNQPYTVAQLQELTGLSPYQIRESNKILQDNEIYRTSKAYLDFNRCLGSNVELNGFYFE